MALLDFLKPKQKPVEAVVHKSLNRPECDITKTPLMIEAFKVPVEERDENWMQAFLKNVQTASYACGQPQTLQGPDGFTYFILQSPEENKAFESFCIRNMTEDFLLQRGCGVVINPKTDGTADWVFSYGDIVNLYCRQEFYTDDNTLGLPQTEIIKEAEQVMVGQPSESFLPRAARGVLKNYFEFIGIKKPKVMLVNRTAKGQLSQSLAFNMFSENFTSTAEFESRIKQIGWFLPKHYTLLSIPKSSDIKSGFANL